MEYLILVNLFFIGFSSYLAGTCRTDFGVGINLLAAAVNFFAVVNFIVTHTA